MSYFQHGLNHKYMIALYFVGVKAASGAGGKFTLHLHNSISQC
uniref:Uncharacterized protein n=1 Tax=Aegilops tauschii subsp. strangulata TaxID=200361 RepID=A0A453NDZ5_AEGTS